MTIGAHVTRAIATGPWVESMCPFNVCNSGRRRGLHAATLHSTTGNKLLPMKVALSSARFGILTILVYKLRPPFQDPCLCGMVLLATPPLKPDAQQSTQHTRLQYALPWTHIEKGSSMFFCMAKPLGMCQTL